MNDPRPFIIRGIARGVRLRKRVIALSAEEASRLGEQMGITSIESVEDSTENRTREEFVPQSLAISGPGRVSTIHSESTASYLAFFCATCAGFVFLIWLGIRSCAESGSLVHRSQASAEDTGNDGTSDSITSAAVERTQNPITGSVSGVMDWFEQNLNDKTSLEVLAWGEVRRADNGNYSVWCKYRAKNGFGALMIARSDFVLDANGKVISATTSE